MLPHYIGLTVYRLQMVSMLVEDLKLLPLADLDVYRSRKQKLRQL